MDAVLFKSGQKLEHFQVQINLGTSYIKDILQQYFQYSKSIIFEAWSGPSAINVKSNIRELWQYIIGVGLKLRQQIWLHMDPQKFYYNLVRVFWKKWTKRDLCFLAAGFVCGSIAGVIFTFSLKKTKRLVRYMQAVQCVNYLGIESATVVENAKAPDQCGDNDVMITVKAASVHVIDAEICGGYGRTLRKILQKLYKGANQDLPVTLGRDCTGVVVSVGANVRKLKVGDEVWVAVPFWLEGTMSQTVVIPEYRVGRKPKNCGFEGACSFPYAGSLAMHALKDTQTTSENAQNKKFLVVGGCTPVGCVVIQILKNWKVDVTTTCSKRAVPVAKALGAADVIVFPETDKSDLEVSENSIIAFEKELQLRDPFDYIIVTSSVSMRNNVGVLCRGKIISTLPQRQRSDSCGIVGSFILKGIIYTKYAVEKILGLPFNSFDEAHMCNVTLDELTDLVESGLLQTVVDKVFLPKDIEIALNHIQSYDSIGSTIITFR